MGDDDQVVIHFHNYRCCTGRIYDGFTGEFLWESDEHEGAGSTLWTMSTIPNFCGIYDNSGVWLIKSRKAIDQAYFMANALFPISTNADEVCYSTVRREWPPTILYLHVHARHIPACKDR